MAGRGRPRTPVEAKKLLGTYRPDRDGPADAAVQLGGVPEPPERLQGEALALWEEVVPRLVAAQVVTAADAPALAVMCEWHARYLRFSKALDAADPGSKEAYKLTVLASMASARFDAIACRFGMNPSDRAKLRLPAPPPGPMHTMTSPLCDPASPIGARDRSKSMIPPRGR